MPFLREIFLFGIAGGIGFLVDAGVLYLLKAAFGLYVARVVSFLAAAFTTWLVNRNLAFQARKSGVSLHKEFSAYLALMTSGGLVNYALYAWLVTSLNLAAQYPVIGVAVGSLGGMLVNFLTARFLLFKRHGS